MKFYNSNTSMVKIVDAVNSFFFFLSGVFMIELLKSLSSATEKRHQVLGGIFYMLFFLFLMRFIKKARKSRFSMRELFSTGIKRLNVYKWIPLAFTITLISISFISTDFSSNQTGFGYLSFIIMKRCPIIFNQNAAFITITMLVFVTSALLNMNKKLEEEQDLTI